MARFDQIIDNRRMTTFQQTDGKYLWCNQHVITLLLLAISLKSYRDNDMHDILRKKNDLGVHPRVLLLFPN